MFTIREKKGRLDNLEVAIIGDIMFSRVARSNIWGLKKMGARVKVFGPPTLIPPDIEKMGAHVCSSFEEAVEGSDVINILRIQKERQESGLFPSLREYSMLFGVNTGDNSFCKTYYGEIK
jgi:aspartate carbamoyltransferase catalytic subunit